MSTPLFTIIIPAYNVAAYIGECLNSIQAQTFTDWECICVDDGSTDETKDIISNYVDNDKRFILLSQANAGVSAARNTGMEHIRGKYFLFVDGDDLLCPWALEWSHQQLAKYKADALMDESIMQFTHECTFPSMPNEAISVICNDTDGLRHLLVDSQEANGYAWGKIYATGIHGHCRFPVGITMFEDLWFAAEAFQEKCRWIFFPLSFYGYRIREGSACQSQTTVKKVSDILDVEFHVLSVLQQVFPEKSGYKLCQTYWQKNGGVIEWPVRLLWNTWNNLPQGDQVTIQRKIIKLESILGKFPFDRFMWLRLKITRGKFEKTIGFIEWLWKGMKARIRKFVR